MVVLEISGTCPDEVIGRAVAGAVALAGTPVWIVRRHERALRARIVESDVLQDGRVRLVLEGWGHEPLLPGYGIATDPPPRLRIWAKLEWLDSAVEDGFRLS